MKSPATDNFVLPGTIVLLSLAVYANSFPGAFILDDIGIVLNSPLVATLNLKAIFTSDYWGVGDNSGLYRPLTILSHALVQKLFGPGIFFHHLTSVLLHCAVSSLLLLTLFSLGISRSVSFLAAAVFAVHPIHGEVVNELVGKAELLAALFTLLALRTAVERKASHIPFTCAFFAAALLAKESALTFLAILLAADTFRAGSLRSLLGERRRLYLGLAAVAVLWMAARTWVLAMSIMPPAAVYTADNPLQGLALMPRLLTSASLQLTYLRLLIFPSPLLPVYSGNTVGIIDGLLSPWGLRTAAITAALGFLLVVGWRRRRDYALGMALYLASFLVTANVLVLIPVVMAERLAYLPSAGYALAVAGLLCAVTGPLARRKNVILPIVPGVAYIMLLAVMTLARNPEFSHPVRLWEATIRKAPESSRGWYHLAAAHARLGHTEEAEEAFLQAIEADPTFPDTYGRYAILLLEDGRYAEALQTAMKKIEMTPRGVSPTNFLVAKIHYLLGQPGEALEQLEETARFYGRRTEFQEIKALSLDALGREEEAMEIFQVIYPRTTEPDVIHKLAVYLIQSHRTEKAEEVLRDFLARKKTADTFNLLGVALSMQGRLPEAVNAFYSAFELEPASSMYRENLERAKRIAAAGK